MRGHTLAALAAVLAATATQAAPLYGDANGDGVVDFKDAAALLQAAAGLRAADATLIRNGDVAPVNDYNLGSFGDGKITFVDALRVARKAGGLSTAAWPAKSSGYLLEAGNSYGFRKYDASGTALTGPGTSVADPSALITGPLSETVGGITYNNVYVVTPSNGDPQHLVTALDASNTPASLLATQLVFGGSLSTFNPPIVLAKYPLLNGATWSGSTTATSNTTSTSISATYSGSVEGPVSVTIADGVHVFDNAYKVSVSYNAGPLLYGANYYWYVPFLGPVQYGFTQTAALTTKTINPNIKLVSANIHGVLYP